MYRFGGYQVETQTRQIAKIIEEYNEMILTSKQQAELEIRFIGISKGVFMDAFNKFVVAHGKPEISRTIVGSCGSPYGNATAIQDRYLRTLDYSKDTPIQYYSKKTPVSVPVFVRGGPIEYKIALARESTVDEFPLCNDAQIRFKVRASFTIGVWRYDFTAVRQNEYKELSGSMLTLKQALMFGPNDSSVFDRLDDTLISRYEIEIEHLGGLAGKRIRLSEKDLNVAETILGSSASMHTTEKNYQYELYNIARAVMPENRAEKFRDPKFRQKRFVPAVIGLTAATYYAEDVRVGTSVFPPWGFYATVKADGKRAIIGLKSQGKVSIIYGDTLEIIGNDSADAAYTYIVDAEVLDKLVLVFDVLLCAGKNMTTLPFEDRIKHLKECVDALAKHMDKWDVQAKEYVALGNGPETARPALENLRETKFSFPDDGIILVRGKTAINGASQGYFTTDSYKWKPIGMCTVDFLVRKCPAKLIGMTPYETRESMTLYWLFVGISDKTKSQLGLQYPVGYADLFPGVGDDYAPIQFSPAMSPYAYLWYSENPDLDGSVVELGPDEKNISSPGPKLRGCEIKIINWKFHRIRDDRKGEKRYFGNDWVVAENTVSGYWDPLELSGLWERPHSYFMKTADESAKAGNKARRYVITKAINAHFYEADLVVDIAAGQGADLARYADAGVKQLLAMDIDSAAIAELIRRRFSIVSRGRAHKRMGNFSRVGMITHALVGDLKRPVEQTLADMCQFGVFPGAAKGVSCMFAIHYLCDTTDNIRRVLGLVSKLLGPGGVFIFTTMDGTAIHKQLSNVGVGQFWELREHDHAEPKYRIQRLYSEDKLSDAGQMIKIKLPFTKELREEPLCNIKYLLGVAKELGLRTISNDTMDYLDSEFAKIQPSLFEKLTPVDKQYTGLHRIVILQKKA